MINCNFQEKLNALIQETVMEEGKLKKGLTFFHDNNANQKETITKKKKKNRKKFDHSQTVLYDQNYGAKFSFEYFL